MLLYVRNEMAAVESIHRPIKIGQDASGACDVQIIKQLDVGIVDREDLFGDADMNGMVSYIGAEG